MYSRARRIFLIIRPWGFAIGLALILRWTGLLSGVSVLANTALMHAGFFDIDPTETAVRQDFDYNFTIKDLQGNKIDMQQFKGKVIFLNMWATWCGPCRAEMPSIQKLYDKVNRDDFAFIMLSIDSDGDHAKVVNYVTNKAFTFPVYQPSGALPRQLQVPSIPTTFVIGPDGKIRSKKVGTANYNTEKFKMFLLDLIDNK